MSLTVITYGTYDLLHIGHINLLQRARALGDKLIVALSTDDFNWHMKQKKCIQPYHERKLILESLMFVDLVIPENSWEQKIGDVQQYCVDLFVMGDDWAGKFDFLKKYCKVIYLPRTPDVSTTQRKNEIAMRAMPALQIKPYSGPLIKLARPRLTAIADRSAKSKRRKRLCAAKRQAVR